MATPEEILNRASSQRRPAGARVVPYELASDAATMQSTTIPLGIVCTVQLAEPRRVEVISHQSWPRTIAWLSLSAVAALSVLLALLQARRLYRHWRKLHSIP